MPPPPYELPSMRQPNYTAKTMGRLWRKVKKINWYGKDTIENAANTVVLEHNFGVSDTNIMNHMGLSGSSSREYLDGCRDRAKVHKSGIVKSNIRNPRADSQEDPDYGAGNF